ARRFRNEFVAKPCLAQTPVAERDEEAGDVVRGTVPEGSAELVECVEHLVLAHHGEGRRIECDSLGGPRLGDGHRSAPCISLDEPAGVCSSASTFVVLRM